MKNFWLFLIIFFSGFDFYAQSVPPVNLEIGYSFDASHDYILYPSPDTDFQNVVEVGPGMTYQEIHDIPLSLIVMNTLIKIHYRDEPYRTQVFIDVVATENEKVRFQGIPNSNGDLPVISFINATTWGNTIDATLQSGSGFIVYGTWGNKPAWIEIVNLHIMDSPYAGIWIKGDHISVKGCILENAANGVFFQAANQLLLDISTHMLIEGCKFTNNGTVNGWLHHNIYTQGAHCLIQFNTIEPVRLGSLGASLKDRSSHTVIRYNKIGTSSRTLDLVEPEDTDLILTQDADWGDVYIYGNLILNTSVPVSQTGVSMIHYGYDNSPTFKREGTLYCSNNTIIVDRSDNPWRVNLFDVNSENSTIEFSNNIVTADGMQTFYIFRSNNTDNAGVVNFNTSYFSINNTQNNWELTEAAGSYFMSGQNNIIEGTVPGFTNELNNNFTLVSGSPCIGTGIDISSTFNFGVDYNSISDLTDYSRTDQSNPNLGCFSSDQLTNYITKVDFFNRNLIDHSVFPNPFNENTMISFTLPQNAFCSIVIYDFSGREIKKIGSGNYSSGKHLIEWNGTDSKNKRLPKGCYFYSIEMKMGKVSGKVIVN